MLQDIEIKALKGKSKIQRLKIKPDQYRERLKKPHWIRVKYKNSKKVQELKQKLRDNKVFTICEEGQCPNLNECFNNGTATFIIMGQICTRRCPFCDVAHGKPYPLDKKEPENLAKTIYSMKLNYVVITSVDRDDLRDGGATHFKKCIDAIKDINPLIKIEILVPDFRGRKNKALDILHNCNINVFNHNLETVPVLYPKIRPGSDYQHSLNLLKEFKEKNPNIKTKSGLMLGVGENKNQVIEVLQDLHTHKVDMITLGQYLQPSKYHLAVEEYITLAQFQEYRELALKMGFCNVASAPMVRSSYHADLQSNGNIIC